MEDVQGILHIFKLKNEKYRKRDYKNIHLLYKKMLNRLF